VRRQRRLELLQLFEVGLGLGKVGFQSRLLLGAGRLRDLRFELLDLLGHQRELLLDVADAARACVWVGQVLSRALGSDDLEVAELLRVHLIALPVIPVKVRVDDLADRLLGDGLDLAVQRVRRGGLGVRIHHDDAVVGEDHCRVGVDLVARGRDRSIHAVGHRLELEQVLFRRLGIRREHAARIEVVERLNRRNR